jgi:hypothetical protein
MTCPKSLGLSLHAQPEPCESVVSLGISSIDHHLLRLRSTLACGVRMVCQKTTVADAHSGDQS